MRRKAGIICMFLGAVLVAMALSLFLYNKWDADRAAKASEKIMSEMDTDGETEDADPYYQPGREMTTKTIDGNEYIGYLSIPSINLELPVMAEWSYPGLKIAPGRYSGTTFADDLVICGHNYARHFSPIKWLKEGTEVIFTDMDNLVWHYQVASIETLKPMQVEEMTTKTDGDDWDLTLFTCNTGGQTRCAVRCVRVI